MPARQLEAKAISPESGKGFSRKNDCESSRIVARSVRLMRRPMTMRIAITAAALGAMVWLVGAASSSAQDRPAPDCLLTYANGQLCGRTSIHEAFKCVAFLRGKDVLSTGADTCVASKDRHETCRVALISGGRVFLDKMTVWRAELYCPNCVVPPERRIYECIE
jgi:hypothetical protein